MIIRQLTAQEHLHLIPLLQALWPGQERAEWLEELENSTRDPEVVFFLAWEGEHAIGFSQVQLRHDYVEGTNSSPVGYLEGLYVHPNYRQRGIARHLVTACEEWASSKGCSEFASDVELPNVDSQRMHEKLGFQEANRVVCYVKPLGGT